MPIGIQNNSAHTLKFCVLHLDNKILKKIMNHRMHVVGQHYAAYYVLVLDGSSKFCTCVLNCETKNICMFGYSPGQPPASGQLLA